MPRAEKVLFGLDDCAGATEIIVVEGEMDKLALEEAGFRHVVSVPDGAPARCAAVVVTVSLAAGCLPHHGRLALPERAKLAVQREGGRTAAAGGGDQVCLLVELPRGA